MASITTRVMPNSVSRVAIPVSVPVIVEYVFTSCNRRPGFFGSGIRTQHTSDAFPISSAAD